jgi:cytochrome c oxidase subunit 4
MPWRSAAVVWVLLVMFVLLTFWLAYQPLHRWQLPVALLIAAIKAGLVGIVFMETRRAHPFIRLAAATGFLFVSILLGLTFVDFLSRGD